MAEFNGYANRETWACNLWLNNDEGLHDECSRLAVRVTNRSEKPDAINELALLLKEYVEGELKDFCMQSPIDSEIRSMFDDIGSLWRVDWNEIADGFVDAALE